jgi:hypothetical protein
MGMQAMSPLEQKIKELRATGPLRKDFPDEDSYQEAAAGWRHRVGPAIRMLEFQLRMTKREPDS